MKPSFATLKSNHYSSDPNRPGYVSAEDLYREIGQDLGKLMAEDAGYANTCATRMSLALIKSGVPFAGRLKIKAGAHLGKKVEPGAKLLADQLARKDIFGRPLLFSDASKAAAALQNKKGVAFFWKITGYAGGHIDVFDASNGTQVCNSHCYFGCKEVWFWSLA
jgi:hypothetical protein